MSTDFFGVLTIVPEGEPEQDHCLTGEVMQVGSANGVDIHVVGEQVARVHAQLHCNARGIWIEDLNSRYGTWVDDQRIESSEEVPLKNESRIRFGKMQAYIRLAPSTETPSPMRLSLSAMPDKLTVAVGQTASLILTIHNLADWTRTVTLDVSYPPDPPAWVRLPQQPITLYNHPNREGKDSGTVMITFAPPADSGSTAGEYEFKIEARPKEQPDNGTPYSAERLALLQEQPKPPTVTIKLHVLPYVDFDAKVETRKVQGRRSGPIQLRLENRSNFDLPLVIGVDEPEAVLAFTNPGARVRSTSPSQIVPAGGLWEGDLPLAARRWRLIGGSRRYPFKLIVAPDADDLRVKKAAETSTSPRRESWTSKDCTFVQLALLPYWALLPLLLVVVLIIWALWPEHTWISFSRSASTARLAQQPLADALQLPGSVVALATTPLSFTIDGVVGDPVKAEGTYVTANQPIAILRMDAQQQALAEKRGQLEQANRALQQATKKYDQDSAQAEQDLEKAQQEFDQLKADAQEEAQQNIITAQRGLSATLEIDSAAKTAAETKMLQARSALLDAQLKLNQAETDRYWVRTTKTHPTERYTDTYGKSLARPLTDVEQQAFEDAVPQAARVVSDTERLMALAVQEYEVAQEAATNNSIAAVTQIEQATKALEDTQAGKGTPELEAAQQAVDDAQRALDDLRENTLDAEQLAVAALTVEIGVIEGQQQPQLLAPVDGWVVKAPQPGDQVRASAPVALFAPADTEFEIVVRLDEKQWQRIAAARQIIATLSGGTPTQTITATLLINNAQRLRFAESRQARVIIPAAASQPAMAILELLLDAPAQTDPQAAGYLIHFRFAAQTTQPFKPDAGPLNVRLDTRLDRGAGKLTFMLPPAYVCGTQDSQYVIIRQDNLVNLLFMKRAFLERRVDVNVLTTTNDRLEVEERPANDQAPATNHMAPAKQVRACNR